VPILDFYDSTNEPKRKVPIVEGSESNEPLVSLANLSEKITIFPYYYHHRIPGSFNDCYVREGVAEKLIEASKKSGKRSSSCHIRWMEILSNATCFIQHDKKRIP
jgi:hypothetical protein